MQIALTHSPSVAIDLRPVINSVDIRMDFDRGEITVLLERVAAGDRSAEEALMPRVYVELHRLAMARLNSERPGHTLQATALVHEVYLRMCHAESVQCQNRGHFFRIAARLMRRILVDYARQHNAGKRNHGARPESLDQAIALSADHSAAAIEVDQLLEKLAELSPRQAQIVELRFYAGLTEEEIAAAVGVHVRTVRRDWLVARAWLYSQLRRP
jgi:RNA polymerase sigma-70 factor (ECF subfamily)